MKTDFHLTQAEAEALIRQSLEENYPNIQIDNIKVEEKEKHYNMTPGSNGYNATIASHNKITLIKLIRQVAEDVWAGRILLRMPENGNTKTIPLADAKNYIENYFKLK